MLADASTCICLLRELWVIKCQDQWSSFPEITSGRFNDSFNYVCKLTNTIFLVFWLLPLYMKLIAMRFLWKCLISSTFGSPLLVKILMLWFICSVLNVSWNCWYDSPDGRKNHLCLQSKFIYVEVYDGNMFVTLNSFC